ncbi:MAG: FHA domain-containing protein, partial [Sporichthyaceae bacterium]
SGAAVLPDVASTPPATLFPIAPTFARRVRRPPGTTHDPAHGGGARLMIGKQDLWKGHGLGVYWLDAERTTIGSGPECDIVLAGLAPHHATVVHDEIDEFRVSPASADVVVRVHGERVHGSRLLRTGSRVELGDLALGFYREEFADHGRPYGGRIGGEAGHQRPQPPRTVA